MRVTISSGSCLLYRHIEPYLLRQVLVLTEFTTILNESNLIQKGEEIPIQKRSSLIEPVRTTTTHIIRLLSLPLLLYFIDPIFFPESMVPSGWKMANFL